MMKIIIIKIKYAEATSNTPKHPKTTQCVGCVLGVLYNLHNINLYSYPILEIRQRVIYRFEGTSHILKAECSECSETKSFLPYHAPLHGTKDCF